MISFPVLKTLTIEKYGLLPASQKEPFVIKFLPGQNAIIGVNGSGKTTLINVALRCLTGPFNLPASTSVTEFGQVRARLISMPTSERTSFARRVAGGAKDATATLVVSFGSKKGAGGRFIRRADKGKPFATGLKAADPAAAANAGAACGRTVALARVARAKAELAQRDEATICAIDTVDKAFAELNRYRAARAKAGQPGLRDDDRVAQLLVRTAEIAAARLQHLLPR